MRACTPNLWRRRRPGTKTSTPRRAPAAPLRLGPCHAQTQSPFFAKLPAEMRLLIYEAFLVGPGHLLHILHAIPYVAELNRMGYKRCDDIHNQHLTWQHQCFGTKVEDGLQVTRRAPNTNSNLLALLRACRSTSVCCFKYAQGSADQYLVMLKHTKYCTVEITLALQARENRSDSMPFYHRTIGNCYVTCT
jgi:hypothetical protein